MDTFFVMNALKKELREARWTYRDLAKELKISEAGVKKIFSKNNISLKRVFEICHSLNISLPDLLAQSEAQAKSAVRFTGKQVVFFKQNLSYFHFYMRLAYEQKSPAQIQSEFQLSARSLQKYLKKLEELELISRLPKERVQILGGAPLSVSTQGTELESIKYQLAEDLIASIRSTGSGNVMGGTFLLSASESAQLNKDLMNLLTTYSVISNTNRRSKRSQEFSTESLMLTMAPRSIFNRITEV